MNAAANIPAPDYPSWRAPSMFGGRSRRTLFFIAVILYIAWSVTSLEIDWTRVAAGLPRAGDIITRMFPPSFERWELLASGMIESIQMAIASTIVGGVLSIPIGVAAARNLSPRLLYLAARGLIVVGRTFHEVIIAIFFVKLFGFGPVAGLLTLAFSSAIFLGKMLAEDIENMKSGPVEAVRATGASFGQVIAFAVAPQVIVRTLGVYIYRLDSNLRHSTVIGIVGAGGIGQTLSASFSRYDFDFACAILLTIGVMVAFGEWFSDWVRRRVR